MKQDWPLSKESGQLKLLSSITSLNTLFILVLLSGACINTLLSNGAEAKLKFL